jgi:hypothetical protein
MSIPSTIRRLAAFASLAAAAFPAVGCYGGIYGGEPGTYPSSEFIASEDPVYYDGQANYLYDGLWYYRRGSSWGYYGSEPDYLRNYRTAHPGMRGGARGGGARGGARGGGRGGHGGGGRGGGGRGGGGGRR